MNPGRARVLLLAAVPVAVLGCTDRHPTTPAASEPGTSTSVDQALGQNGVRVSTAIGYASRPLRDIPPAQGEWPEHDHEPGRNPFMHDGPTPADPGVQANAPILSMPASIHSFLAQGATLEGCVFPKPDGGEPPHCTTRGDPPDTEGAVGLNHYVQIVNSGIAIWDKDGGAIGQPIFTSDLFSGLPNTDGNRCDAPPSDGGDWGDGVVLYDQLADRWVITQFDLSNYVNKSSGPSYQCVAVSQTGDPGGAYWLYDFQYSSAINDYGKFSVWPDGYYASYNDFNPGFVSANLCAFDRVSMLQGKPATQHCFTNSGFGFLPGNIDGLIPPPQGEPAFFVTLGSSAVDLYKFHVDWTTPANSTFTGPTSLSVNAFIGLCAGGSCVKAPSPGNSLGSLGDRPMFHLGYRNFGAYESLFFNHSIATLAGTGGPRWYEIRSPNGTPSLFQQGTYAPSDGNYRWMGSLGEDQAEDMALGFSLSGTSTLPTIAWTGRLATDAKGTMGQGEGSVATGTGVETGTFSDGTLAQRWGDYSNMTVDPADDCTFWYTQELYPANGVFNWDTHVASVKFPNCAANDFTPAVAPAAQNLQQGKTSQYTVSTTLKAGTAETVALFVQNLPTGVSAAFNPTTVTAGASSTMTLTAALAAPLGTATFTVIGKAPSAVHLATGQVTVVVPCTPLTTCPAGDNCGTIPDNCGGQVSCGPACTLPQTCGGGGTANVCGCTPITACDGGLNCGTISNNCGGQVTCGPACSSPQSCGGGGTPNICGCTPITGCDAGANCGTVPDTCGGQVTCGPSCTSPQTCGGGGTLNVCGCTPLTACPNGDTCGTLSDNCGGSITCSPGCTGSQTCVSNRCVAPGSDGGTQQQGDGGSGGGGKSTSDCGCGATSSSSAAALLCGALAWLGAARRRRA